MRHLTAATLFCAAVVGILGCSEDNPAPAATQLSMAPVPSASGDGQLGEAGAELDQSIRVRVLEDGLPAVGLEVNWAASAGAGVVAPAIDITDANGIAEAGWTLATTIGPMTATASLTDAAGSPVTFHATAKSGPATVFLIQTGNNQLVKIGTTAGEPLGVGLQDQYGNPVPVTVVIWEVMSGAATLSAGTGYVDLTAGLTPGPVVVRATPAQNLPSVNFTLTIVP